MPVDIPEDRAYGALVTKDTCVNGEFGSGDALEAWQQESPEHRGSGSLSDTASMLSVYSYDRFLAVMRREISIDEYAREVSEHVDAQLLQR